MKSKYENYGTWEDTVDGLGMEDFPERDYFMEAGELLREAASLLKKASGYVEWYNDEGLHQAFRLDDLAARIDALLKQEGDS